MALFINGENQESKHEYASVTAAGSTIATSVPALHAAIFVGPTINPNLQEVVSSLRNCMDAIRETSILTPGAGGIAGAHTLAGAGSAAVVYVNDMTTIADTQVAVAYRSDFARVPASSELLDATVKRLIEWWLETVSKLS